MIPSCTCHKWPPSATGHPWPLPPHHASTQKTEAFPRRRIWPWSPHRMGFHETTGQLATLEPRHQSSPWPSTLPWRSGMPIFPPCHPCWIRKVETQVESLSSSGSLHMLSAAHSAGRVVPRGFCTKEVPHSRKESTVLEARGGKNACSAPIKDPGCCEPTVHGDDVVKKTSRKRKTCQFLMCKDIYGSFLKWWVSPHFTPQNAHF